MFVWSCSVSGPAGEHLPIPGHDYAERPQDDRGGPARGSHSVRGPHQSAQLHHGRQPNAPDVGAPRTVMQAGTRTPNNPHQCRVNFFIAEVQTTATLKSTQLSRQRGEEPDPSAEAAAGRGLPGVPARRPGEGPEKAGGAGAAEAGGGEGSTERSG